MYSNKSEWLEEFHAEGRVLGFSSMMSFLLAAVRRMPACHLCVCLVLLVTWVVSDACSAQLHPHHWWGENQNALFPYVMCASWNASVLIYYIYVSLRSSVPEAVFFSNTSLILSLIYFPTSIFSYLIPEFVSSQQSELSLVIKNP